MLGIDEKNHLFPKIFTYAIYDIAVMKTLSTRGRVILPLSFPDNIFFLKHFYFLVFHFSTHYQSASFQKIKRVKFDKRVKPKSQTILGTNYYVCRSYRGKSCSGDLFAQHPESG